MSFCIVETIGALPFPAVNKRNGNILTKTKKIKFILDYAPDSLDEWNSLIVLLFVQNKIWFCCLQ
jgi:hypothetical protein